MPIKQPVIIQVIGYKNTGKTTLLCLLVERLKAAGFTVGTVKHDAHEFNIDHEGTDTWRHQQAGADMTAITSPSHTAWIAKRTAPLEELLRSMQTADFILVEGFKMEHHPKLILLKQTSDLPLLELSSPSAALLWPHCRIKETPGIPQFGIDDIEAVTRLLLQMRS